MNTNTTQNLELCGSQDMEASVALTQLPFMLDEELSHDDIADFKVWRRENHPTREEMTYDELMAGLLDDRADEARSASERKYGPIQWDDIASSYVVEKPAAPGWAVEMVEDTKLWIAELITLGGGDWSFMTSEECPF